VRRNLEHRAGVEPANTGFADLRVSHFATGALKTGNDGARERVLPGLVERIRSATFFQPLGSLVPVFLFPCSLVPRLFVPLQLKNPPRHQAGGLMLPDTCSESLSELAHPRITALTAAQTNRGMEVARHRILMLHLNTALIVEY
jgi:hypothetical protein